MRLWKTLLLLAFGLSLLIGAASAPGQDEKKKDTDKKDEQKKEPDKRPPFGGGKGGFGPMGQVRKVVAQFDKDKDGRLNDEERKTAREWLKKNSKGGFGKGPKGGFGKGGNKGPAKEGVKIEVKDAKAYPKAKLYDPAVLRTFFLEFKDKDWEDELADFYKTDVEVPATLIVDGKKYPNVGVRFRGMSSYFTVGKGWKRSISISMDYADKDQRLYGHKSLNLLNMHDDPTFMHTVLYSEIAGKSIPTPKANFVKVAINGESWGLYTNAQQFNKEFTEEAFGSKKGDRWKVQGSPGGRGGLEYLGDKLDDYKRRYTLKTAESEEAWKALARLTKVLNTTPADKLEAALKPILDLDGVLWFLALDVTLINMDGYWVRASDYHLYRDKKGKFHLVPHDMNETFVTAGGFGMGGPGGGRPGKGGRFTPLNRPALEAADSDKDGKLTKDEVVTGVKALYKAVDADKKGEVTLEALEKTLEKILPKPQGFGGFTPPSPAPGLAKSIVEKAGKDGKVTQAALVAEAEKRFKVADKNKDEKLDEEELAEALREIMPGPRFGGPGGGGPGFGGPRGGGLELDPLVGLTDNTKPLRSKLLAVPALKERYLKYVKIIAEERLDWKKLGPRVAEHRKLIEKEVEADTKKLYDLDAFKKGVADEAAGTSPGRGAVALRTFADQRRKYLLNHAEIKKLTK